MRRLLSSIGEYIKLLPSDVTLIFLSSMLLVEASISTIYPLNVGLATQNIDDWPQHEDREYGISLQYPQKWKYIGNSSTTDFGIAGFEAPLTRMMDYIPVVWVNVDSNSLADQSVAMTPEKYAQEVIKIHNQTHIDFRLVENITNTTLDGRPAYNYTYSYSIPGEKITFLTTEVGTIIGKRAYFIEYIVEEEKYSKHWPTVKKIVDSFNISQLPPSTDNSTIRDPIKVPSFYYDTDMTLNINLRIPFNWIKEYGDVFGFIPTLGSTFNNSAYYYAPYESRLDPIQELFLVQVENLPPFRDVSLEEYVNATIPILKEDTTYFNLTKNTPILLSGIPAQILEYDYTFEGLNYSGMEIVAINNDNDKVYYLTFSAESSKYPAYLPIIQTILTSLRFETGMMPNIL